MTDQRASKPPKRVSGQISGQVIERVLVALDASRHSASALKGAAQLAAALDAELHGIFVEDIDLVHSYGLPCCQEIGSYTAVRRSVDGDHIARQFRVMEQQMEEIVAETARQMQIDWSFETSRGSVVGELLRASQQAAMLTVGRSGHSNETRLGSKTRAILAQASGPVWVLDRHGRLDFPLTLVYTGSPAATRAIRLVVRLMQKDHAPLKIYLWSEEVGRETEVQQQLTHELAAAKISGESHTLYTPQALLAAVAAQRNGTLIIPHELQQLVEDLQRSAILVP